jgi:hypothetical protein
MLPLNIVLGRFGKKRSDARLRFRNVVKSSGLGQFELETIDRRI